jgi:hypothetical protein
MPTSSLYSITGYVNVHKDVSYLRPALLRAAGHAKTETSKRPSQTCVQAAEQVWPPDQPSENFKGNSVTVLCTSVTMVWGLVKYYTSCFTVWLCVTTNRSSRVIKNSHHASFEIFLKTLKSSQRRHCVIARGVPHILKGHSAFIFRKKQSKENGMLDLEDWDTTLPAMSVTLYQLTYNQMTEDLTITNNAV